MRTLMRPYNEAEDYFRVRTFLTDTYALNQNHHSWCVERWDYCRYFVWPLIHGENGPRQLEAITRLWETEDGRLVGVALSESGRGDADMFVHPDFRHVESDMLDWAEESMPMPDENGHRKLSIMVYSYDTLREDLLASRGFKQENGWGVKRRCRLKGAVPEPVVPAEYTLRHIRPDDGPDERNRVMAKAFNSGKPAEDWVYRSLQAAPGYQMENEFIVVAPDGHYASLALVWYDKQNRIGMFEPVGTDPAHQRKGLGTAVMYAGLRRLQALGATMAYVGTGSATAANRLYESTGFVEVDTEYPWVKLY